MAVTFTTQIMAIGLTVSQLVTAPAKNFQRHFDPKDTARVAKILHDGCVAFDVPIADLIDDAVKDGSTPNLSPAPSTPPAETNPAVSPLTPGKTAGGKAAATDKAAKPAAPGNPALVAPPLPKGVAAKIALVDWKAMQVIAHQVCEKGEIPDDSPAHLPDVIAYFNEVFSNVDDISFLKDYHPPSSNGVLDGKEGAFTDMYKPDNHRVYVRLDELPKYVPQAFVSAEDKMFYKHGGIDTTGIMRAAVNLLGGSGKTVGGSTIPQQTIKNATKKNDPTFARKMTEMYLASLLTETVSKNQILEIYLNEIPFGRGAVGIGMAAKVYFGKPASQLTISEAATLAGVIQGPEWINPDKNLALVEKKRQYVLGRMLEDVNNPEVRRYTDGIHARVAHKTNQYAVLAAEITQAQKTPPTFIARPRPTAAFYFVDEINRQVQQLKTSVPELADFDQGGYVVHSTIDPKIQAAVTVSLQDGLNTFERRVGRVKFKGRVGSLAKKIAMYQKSWKELLPDAKADVFVDVLWPLAVVLPASETGGKTCPNHGLVLGTKKGTLKCLNAENNNVRGLQDYDLVFVRAEDDSTQSVRLMVPPEVQGATIVVENLTGRVLGLSGGFSYGASDLNRATRTRRQPGSTMKPLTYLYAMNQGYQPNTLISNMRKVIVGPNGVPWSPRNYNRDQGGMLPLRIALENSMNVPTANLASLLGIKGIQALGADLGLQADAENLDKFPWVLGAQPFSLKQMAQAYTAIANLGLMPREIYFVEGIEKDGRPVWTRQRAGLRLIKSADRTSFYLLRSMMAGVVTDGTAKEAMKDEFGGYVAAKTGTSERANDAWFIAVTNDYTVATWVGYDNGKGEPHRTLGDKTTGSLAALPIAQRVLRYLNYNPANPSVRNFKKLSAPPLAWDPELKKYVDTVGEAYIDGRSGEFANSGFKEVFRLQDPHGCAVDRAQGRNDRCDVVDKWQALVQPGDLRRIDQPSGDGDAESDSAQPLTQANEIRERDDRYQPYQPDRGEPRLPQNYDRNYQNLQQMFHGWGM